MTMGNNYLVKRTSSFGRKRILILNEMDIDFDSISPTKKQSIRTEKSSLLQDLPQDIIVSCNSNECQIPFFILNSDFDFDFDMCVFAD